MHPMTNVQEISSSIIREKEEQLGDRNPARQNYY
jgi:hypothetical protein